MRRLCLQRSPGGHGVLGRPVVVVDDVLQRRSVLFPVTRVVVPVVVAAVVTGGDCAVGQRVMRSLEV